LVGDNVEDLTHATIMEVFNSFQELNAKGKVGGKSQAEITQQEIHHDANVLNTPDGGTLESMTGKENQLVLRKDPLNRFDGNNRPMMQVTATEILDADGNPSNRKAFDIKGCVYSDAQIARLKMKALRAGTSWDTGEDIHFQSPFPTGGQK
jgi:hypothetical protein